MGGTRAPTALPSEDQLQQRPLPNGTASTMQGGRPPMASFLKTATSERGGAESRPPVDRAAALDSIARLDQERPGTLQRILQQVRAMLLWRLPLRAWWCDILSRPHGPCAQDAAGAGRRGAEGGQACHRPRRGQRAHAARGAQARSRTGPGTAGQLLAGQVRLPAIPVLPCSQILMA